MALIVQKYGGSSVGSIDRIHGVAEKVVKTRADGHALVVVVSAMQGETDRLASLAQQLSKSPNPREVDVLLSTGEQVSIALLAMALLDRGCPARSYTGSQVHIRTDNVHNKARILGIESSRITSDLAEGQVVVVAGFQGTDGEGNITTLGRGGSDTTAVALAAALQADECQIYTDVDGVYTADPSVVPDARKMSQITFEEMLELSSLGVKVMQNRAVEFAGKYKLPVRVLSTFNESDAGTLISVNEHSLERPPVTGIACSREEAKLTIQGLPDTPGAAAQILKSLSQAFIEVDMIVQSFGRDKKTDLSLVLARKDYPLAHAILRKTALHMGASDIIGNTSVGKLSLVGVGIRSHVGVAGEMFQVLGKAGINIQLVSTSEIKVSVVVDEKQLEAGARALHHAFQLGDLKKDEN